MHTKSKRHKWPLYVLCIFLAGLVSSCFAMQASYTAGNQQLVLIFALASGVMCVASCISFWGLMVGIVARRAQTKVSATMHSGHDDQDYRAVFSLKDRISLLFLTVGSALLTAFSFAHSGHYPMKALFVGIFIFCSIAAYRHCSMSVLFGRSMIEVKTGLFTRYSELYSQVVALTVAPRSLKLRFADGRKLSILPGFGDMAQIATLLEKRTKATPEFIGWNGGENPPRSTRPQD